MLLLQTNVQSCPLFQLGLEGAHVHASPDVCWYGVVVAGTPTPEALSWNVTLVSERLVLPDAPTGLLSGSV